MRTSTVSGFLAAAIPVASAAKAYIPYAANHSLPEIHHKPIAAANGLFWVNKSTTAVCPSYDPHCPSQNTTIISGPVFGSGIASNSQYWFMGILDSEGQMLDQSGWDLGTGGLDLLYTAGHSGNYFPAARSSNAGLGINNSTVTPRLIAKEVEYGDGPLGWSACEDGSGAWQVKTGPVIGQAPRDGCVVIEILLRETTAAAPEFYYCDGCQYRCNNIYGSDVCMKATCEPPYCGAYT